MADKHTNVTLVVCNIFNCYSVMHPANNYLLNVTMNVLLSKNVYTLQVGADLIRGYSKCNIVLQFPGLFIIVLSGK